ncbi:MAG: hypothetical protein BWY57_02501 [Betaproteobacteria bacterium ADurb.Bin341]|nr:MAG: hypothetical protein BWY57_02501 [Betaproteobacteria bacterium ADurb.Bin341]
MVLLADGLKLLDLGVDGFLGHAVGFEQQDGLNFRQAEFFGLVGGDDGDFVDQFQHRRLAAAGHDLGNGITGFSQRVELGNTQATQPGDRHKTQRGFDDHAQRAFRTHHQAFKRIARRGDPGV